MSYEIQAASNYGHDVREFNRNNEPEAVIRELFSNAKDALAKNIYFGPLATCFTRKRHTGFYFFDDGVGMHPNSLERGSVKDDAPVNLLDDEGNHCGSWYAFITNGFSSKRRQSLIGHKGQGSKLLFSCKDRLLVISKAKIKSTNWLVCNITKPEEHMLGLKSELHFDQTNSMESPKVKIIEMSGKELEKYVEDIWESIKGNDNENKNISRMLHVQDNLKTVIKADRGTLIFAFGVSDPDLQTYLGQLDKDFSPYSDGDATVEGIHVNNMIRLLAFMEFKTIMGHPLAEKSLQMAGFDNNLVDQYTTKSILPKLHLNTQKVQNHSIIPGLTTVPNKHSQGDNACPLKIKEMKKARFQDRHIAQMTVEQNKYTILLLLDGTAHRLETYSMLGRRGGSRKIQKRSGIAMSEFTGVTLYCKGMYLCRFDSLLDHETYGDFQKLSTESVQYTGHFQLVIDCDNIDVISSRNGISTIAKQDLTCQEFRTRLRDVLKDFRANDSVFNRFVKRLNKLTSDALEKGAVDDRESRLRYIQSLQRVEIELNGLTHYILEPGKGDENLVIGIYFEMRALLRAEINGMQDDPEKSLKCLWPDCKHVTGGAGLDCVGLMANVQTSLSTQIPESACAHIEFKSLLKILNRAKPYNHSLTVTDFIICWDFEHDENTVLDAINNKSWIVDHIGNKGKASNTVSVYAGKSNPPLNWQIPDSMRGFCFCINRIEKDGELKQLTGKVVQGVIVFALKKLIEVTLGSGKITYLPPTDAPQQRKRQKLTNLEVIKKVEDKAHRTLANAEGNGAIYDDGINDGDQKKIVKNVGKKRWDRIISEKKVFVHKLATNKTMCFYVSETVTDTDMPSGSSQTLVRNLEKFSGYKSLKDWAKRNYS